MKTFSTWSEAPPRWTLQPQNRSESPRNIGPPMPFSNSTPSDGNSYYECSNCKKQVAANSLSCPHCKTPFSYVEDEQGNRTATGYGSFRGTMGMIKLAVIVTIAVCGWAGRKMMNA